MKLSQAALALQGKSGTSKDIQKCLNDLHLALVKISKRANVLNGKLADYVFFPLSHVLRQLENIPVRSKELTLECISILLNTAWKSEIAPPLAIQFLILFSFLADAKEASTKGQQSSEELQCLALTCIEAVFVSLSRSPAGRQAILSVDNIPHTGKVTSVILDEAYEGSSAEVQLCAVSALNAFCTAIDDREALGTSFLPGVMSCLTKVLTPATSAKRSYKVLARSLELLSKLLPFVLGDTHTKDLPESDDATNSTGKVQLSKSWLNATAPQIKMALANIVKLRYHDHPKVCKALAQLCLSLLQECRSSLSDAIPMLLECLISIIGTDSALETGVKTLLAIEPSFVDTLRESVHGWSASLPRVMLQADETAKRRLIQRISTAFSLLTEQGVDMSLVDNAVALNLVDTVANAIQVPKVEVQVQQEPVTLDIQVNGSRSKPILEFEPIMALRKAQEETVTDLSRFLTQLSLSGSSMSIVRDLLPSLGNDNGVSQLARFWICLNLTRDCYKESDLVDSFLDLGITETSSREDVLDQLYSVSLSILSDSAESEHDWRLQALALEAIALKASLEKENFREELCEALYPIVNLVGSSNPQLRNHAMTCLNMLSHSCGYSSSGETIVQNVDYLVNAVAIRLNTFDMSPQAPQVLLMMVKLSGPSLLPYLDDLVDSIFTGLESFHGYPRLVKLLFSVLHAIVEEGAKSPQLLVTNGGGPDTHRKPTCSPTSVEAVLKSIKDYRAATARVGEEMREGHSSNSSFPKEPWKESKATKTSLSQIEEVEDEVPEEDSLKAVQQDDQGTESKPPSSKTYNLILSISKLTQYYLTSETGDLRVSLLSLLDTAIPTLAQHENSLLPLIHTLWPTLIPRINDPEAYVVAETFEVVGSMCVHGGNFMKGRIEGIWPAIQKIYKNRTGKAGTHAKSGQSTQRRGTTEIVVSSGSQKERESTKYYVEVPARIIWNSLINLLVRVVGHVGVTDEIYDDILRMLLPLIETRHDVKEALEAHNPDAVWLALLRLNNAKASSRMQVQTQASRPTHPRFEFVEIF